MKRFYVLLFFITVFLNLFTTAIFARNPFITHLYNADPSAHVFEGRVYVYPSHDKNHFSGNGYFFDMEDYHVYSSADLKRWVDHGVALSYWDPDWVMKNNLADPPTDANSRYPFMWAPDCVYQPLNKTYYLYYPARDESNTFRIGVATSKSPAGPFIPVRINGAETYIPGSFSMDPCVYVDSSSYNAYIFFGGYDGGQLPENGGSCKYGKLSTSNPNDPNTFMVTFEWGPINVQGNASGQTRDYSKDSPFYYYEAPYVFKRGNVYYLTYSTGRWTNPNGNIYYATSSSITGPWTPQGAVIGPVTGWTNHHSFVEFPTNSGNWYPFYHHTKMSGDGLYPRGICVDSVIFNSNGSMNLVTQTTEGTGTSAYYKQKAMFFDEKYGGVRIDESISDDIGKSVSYTQNGNYIVFNNVDFGSIGASKFEVRVACPNNGCSIEVYSGSSNGTLLVTLPIPNTGGWQNWWVVSANVDGSVTGNKNLYLKFIGGSGNLLNLNWFRFTEKPPYGRTIALKSLNPYCLDINGEQGHKYLCVDYFQSGYVCANRSAIGAWEKFTVVDAGNGYIGLLPQYSNNPYFLRSTSYYAPFCATGGTTIDNYYEMFQWIDNGDGTISLYNVGVGQYLCVDSWNYGNNPTRVYPNRSAIGIGEKFFYEIL